MQPLQNVLSISTAGKNRYLFHFNSLHSLTQWTAGIRLAMFEHATLQEAYTGSLIAGKGKSLNNIRVIMERTRLKTEDWCRVRFGAGTPWRRCWCVITPPDEKEIQKQQKSLKKKSVYDRSVPSLKGDIKFYDTKKTKKVQPIATINDAYSAYAIYPQSKPLIDQSTLVKVEGNITIHSTPEVTTEGFVFVMPEVHPAVTGFEMMLRWLFPLYDVFALYGRPNRLIADTLDTRSLMFALPQERRYGYLEILDVAGLIHETGSQMWKEKEWRSRLKELTSARIAKLQTNPSRQRSRASSYRGHRNSLPSRAGTLRYEDGASIRSSPSFHSEAGPLPPTHKQGSTTPRESPFPTPSRTKSGHQRSVSEAMVLSNPQHQRSRRSIHENQANYTPSGLAFEAIPPVMPSGFPPPMPSLHGVPLSAGNGNPQMQRNGIASEILQDRSSSESERLKSRKEPEAHAISQDLRPGPPLGPVAAPPAFAHEAGAKPQNRPHVSPELRRANSRMSITTLSQIVDVRQPTSEIGVAPAGAATAWSATGALQNRNPPEFQWQPGITESELRDEVNGERSLGKSGVIDDLNKTRSTADHSSTFEGMKLADAGRSSPQNFIASERQNTGRMSNYVQNRLSASSQRLLAPSSLSPSNQSPLSHTPSHPLGTPSSPSQGWDHSDYTHYFQQSGSAQIPLNRSSVALENAWRNPTEDHRPELQRLQSGHSITRKPVPSRSPEPVAEPPSPISRSSLESLRQHVIDEHALDQVTSLDTGRLYTMDSHYDHQTSEIDSVYDNDSTVSPDYASTRKSTETKRSKVSVERPRAGVLKTVGTVEPLPNTVPTSDERHDSDKISKMIKPAIPSVDFGPTQVLAPGIGTNFSSDGGATKLSHEPSKSADRLTPSPRSDSPADLQESKNGVTPGPSTSYHERSSSRHLIRPEFDRRTSSGGLGSEHRRSMAWQPGTTIGSGSPGGRQSITPEQYVQQRAAASRVTPVYAHGKKASGQGTAPTISRNSSSEWPLQQHARQASFHKDIPPRPRSGGATIVMNPSEDYAAHLSAREQEHVARMTGSPLINMAGNSSRRAPQGGGLVGAIEAREKEKREIKEGLSGQMVQHAIAQRQHHHQNVHVRDPNRRSSSPQMRMPGQYPPSPGKLTPQYSGGPQQQHGWMAPQIQYAPPQQAQPQTWQQAGFIPSGSPMTYAATQASSPSYQQQTAWQNAQMGFHQQGQQSPGQQLPYGSYFGNGQGGR